MQQQATPNTWFGSDFHFGHINILNFTDRPFMSMEAHDLGLIETWNKYVKPLDIAFVLGDFSFYDAGRTSAILQALNGQKTLIKGNHDHSKQLSRVHGWNKVTPYLEHRVGDDRIVMSHFPFMSWHQQHRGAYHLHGHAHGTMKYPGDLAQSRILDVGIDHTYKLTGEHRPLSWEEIKGLLDGRRASHSVDYHQVRSR